MTLILLKLFFSLFAPLALGLAGAGVNSYVACRDLEVVLKVFKKSSIVTSYADVWAGGSFFFTQRLIYGSGRKCDVAVQAYTQRFARRSGTGLFAWLYQTTHEMVSRTCGGWSWMVIFCFSFVEVFQLDGKANLRTIDYGFNPS